MAENSYLTALLQTGEDLLANHFLSNIIFPALPIALPVEALNLRVLTISIPEQVIGTYEITKRGRKVTRPSGVTEQATDFAFSYRVDKYYGVYNAISAWLAYIQSPSAMTMASDSGVNGLGGASTFRVPIIVNGFDANGNVNNIFTFLGCYPSSQAGIDFDEESGDPITCEVTMQYQTILYPGAALIGV